MNSTSPVPDYFKIWLDEQTKVRRILLIEDNIHDAILMQRSTLQYHCEWVMANDLETALFILKQGVFLGGFSLIFLDLVLSGAGPAEGIDAFQKLNAEFPDIPIVVLSGAITTDVVGRLTALGAIMFAQKPTSFTNIWFQRLFKIVSIPYRPGILPPKAEPIPLERNF